MLELKANITIESGSISASGHFFTGGHISASGHISSSGNIIAGAGAMVILSAALFISAKALQQFASVSFADVGKGILTIGVLSVAAILLGKAAGNLIVGALAVALLGAALIPAAFAFSLLAGVDPMSIVAFSASMIVLGLAVVGLGALMFTGVGALVFGAGLLALVGLGGAIFAMGVGMEKASPHISVFNDFMSGLTTTLEGIDEKVTGITMLSEAFNKLGTSLAFVGTAGISALPVLAGLSAVDSLIEAVSGGGGQAVQQSEFQDMKTSLGNLETKMGELVTGFTEGKFGVKSEITNPNAVSSEFKPNMI